MKAFADDKMSVTKKSNFDLESVENILGKGENAGYQHFLLYPQSFQKFPTIFSNSFLFKVVSLKVGIVWYRKGLTPYHTF